jgi:UDP-N-acetylmuramoylalanine--D-glutamate ligase
VNRILILGTGVSGLAAARLARRLGLSASLFSEGDVPPSIVAEYGCAIGTWDPELLSGIDLVVASPGFSQRSAPVMDSLEWGIPIWSEIEFASRHLTAPLVAITGTNGKTTVTEATSLMLESSGLTAPAVGNIGSPLSDQVGEDVDVLVVEVSSFQLRFCETFHPVAAGITNVAVDHIDWHGSEQAYREAKGMIFANQTSGDLLVYDADDEGAATLASSAPGEKYPVSGRGLPDGGGGPVDGNLVLDDLTIPIRTLTSTDPAHLVNIAMAAVLAMRMGGNTEGVLGAASSFRPGRHRRELVAVVEGVNWVNDSKATNLHAALASVRSFDRVILIAGGLPKGADVTGLAAEPNVVALIGIGTAGPALAEAAGSRGRVASSMGEAVSMAADAATAGDTVLLAPAAASFDQYGSYQERGDDFTGLVNELRGEVVR